LQERSCKSSIFMVAHYLYLLFECVEWFRKYYAIHITSEEGSNCLYEHNQDPF